MYILNTTKDENIVLSFAKQRKYWDLYEKLDNPIGNDGGVVLHPGNYVKLNKCLLKDSDDIDIFEKQKKIVVFSRWSFKYYKFIKNYKKPPEQTGSVSSNIITMNGSDDVVIENNLYDADTKIVKKRLSITYDKLKQSKKDMYKNIASGLCTNAIETIIESSAVYNKKQIMNTLKPIFKLNPINLNMQENVINLLLEQNQAKKYIIKSKKQIEKNTKDIQKKLEKDNTILQNKFNKKINKLLNIKNKK